jgi:hypothetical protein
VKEITMSQMTSDSGKLRMHVVRVRVITKMQIKEYLSTKFTQRKWNNKLLVQKKAENQRHGKAIQNKE